MGNMLTKTAGVLFGTVMGATNAVTDVSAEQVSRYAPYEVQGNALNQTQGNIVTDALGGVCKDGHLNPLVAAGLQAHPEIAAPVSKLLLEVTDGKTSLPVDSKTMPYTAGVVNGFVDKLQTLLGQNEGFKNYVKQLADQPGADPYVRANLVSGALEFGCRQSGQITGLAQDTFNAADKALIRSETEPLLSKSLDVGSILNSNRDQRYTPYAAPGQ